MAAEKKQKKKPGKPKSVAKNEQGLTADHVVFIEKYIQSNNAWQSAIDAGYSDPSYAYQILKIPAVRAEIVRRKDELFALHKKESKSVIDACFALLNMNVDDFGGWDSKGKTTLIPSKHLTREQKYCVSKLRYSDKRGLELCFDLQGRAKAIDFLGRYFGLVGDRDAIEELLSHLPEMISTPLRAAIAKHMKKPPQPLLTHKEEANGASAPEA